MGHPSGRDFQDMVHIHAIENSLLTLEDIKVSNSIFGLGLGSIKGETVQTTPSLVVQDSAAVTALIRQIDHLVIIVVGVIIVVDVMFVNSLTF